MSGVSTASKLTTSQSMDEWQKLFPAAVTDQIKSRLFTKKLVAIAISTICYLRTDLAEKNFVNRRLGSIKLKLLRSSGEEAVGVIAKALKSALGAYDLGYLRSLVIVFTEHKSEPDNAFETYTFTFSNGTGGDEELVLSTTTAARGGPGPSGDDGSERAVISNRQGIYRSTKALLKRIQAVVEDLDVLPNEAFLTMKLYYHEDVTPADYQPNGFVHSTGQDVFFTDVAGRRVKPRLISFGTVDTKFHKVGACIASKAFRQESQEESSRSLSQASSSVRGNASAEDDGEQPEHPIPDGLDEASPDEECQETDAAEEPEDPTKDLETEITKLAISKDRNEMEEASLEIGKKSKVNNKLSKSCRNKRKDQGDVRQAADVNHSSDGERSDQNPSAKKEKGHEVRPDEAAREVKRLKYSESIRGLRI